MSHPEASIEFLAWSNSSKEPRAGFLMESAAKQGIRIRTVPCFGLDEKPKSLLQTLQSVPDDRIAVCTDGFDVLYLRDKNYILQRYQEFDRPIVFGGEVAAVHHFDETESKLAETYADRSYPFLNSGLIIGRVACVKTMLSEIVDTDRETAESQFKLQNERRFRGHFNDQTLFGRYAANNPQSVSVDADGKLFWNASRECQTFDDRFQRYNGCVENRHAGTQPAFLHIPYLNRYYPTYLWVAKQLGIPPASRRFCIDYWENSLDEAMVAVDPQLIQEVTNLPKHRWIRARRLMQHKWSRFRIAVGRIRRQMMGMELPKP